MKKVLLFVTLFFVSAQFCCAGILVIGGLSREKTVNRGEKYEGLIYLKNTGDRANEIKVYQTDYLFFDDGKNFYGDPGSNPRSNAQWLSLGPKRISIPSGDTVSVYYTVNVPNDPELTGSYWSMIMVEPIPETSPESTLENAKEEKQGIKFGVQTIIRYGIQIVTEIDDTGTSNIRLLNKKLIGPGGKKILQFDVENIGNRWLSPFVWAELYNKKGIYIGRFEGHRLRIYPGCSVRHRIDLTEVPKGEYKALVIVDNGDEKVFGAQYALEIE